MYTYFYYGVDTAGAFTAIVAKRKIYIDSLFVTQLGRVYYKNTFTPFIMKVN